MILQFNSNDTENFKGVVILFSELKRRKKKLFKKVVEDFKDIDEVENIKI